MTFRNNLLVSSALAVAAIAGTANAQPVNVIEELVVTAEKREQSLQDVPVAISAFTSKQRDLVGVNSVQDLTNFTPGFTYQSGNDRASMRGIGRLTNVHAVDGAVSINMIHIAPFEAARGLVAGAARLLKPDGKLFLYGPFARNGAHTAPSNADFDASLKARDARWGVRDLDLEIMPLAVAAGLALDAVIEMPANNLSVVLARRQSGLLST